MEVPQIPRDLSQILNSTKLESLLNAIPNFQSIYGENEATPVLKQRFDLLVDPKPRVSSSSFIQRVPLSLTRNLSPSAALGKEIDKHAKVFARHAHGLDFLLKNDSRLVTSQSFIGTPTSSLHNTSRKDRGDSIKISEVLREKAKENSPEQQAYTSNESASVKNLKPEVSSVRRGRMHKSTIDLQIQPDFQTKSFLGRPPDNQIPGSPTHLTPGLMLKRPLSSKNPKPRPLFFGTTTNTTSKPTDLTQKGQKPIPKAGKSPAPKKQPVIVGFSSPKHNMTTSLSGRISPKNNVQFGSTGESFTSGSKAVDHELHKPPTAERCTKREEFLRRLHGPLMNQLMGSMGNLTKKSVPVKAFK